ncbi:roadblock/LC7 domain-containing protein [Hamadaea tsunoensis]|uniref:roadblock/LC7 domain-containing protein n=1 Tax=Hamadaea tsunoensis TaxID=53368 RepID=UPI00040FBC27|nr:roadblock/LC7 domain-containing protein [Hamadaea tsunoensis]
MTALSEQLTDEPGSAVDTGLVLKLLDDVVAAVPGIEHMLSVTGDGLLQAASSDVPRDMADTLAAVVSGLISLGTSADPMLNGGGLASMVLEFHAGYLIVMPVPDGTHLAATTSDNPDLGQISFELMSLAERFGATALRVGRRNA